eukprot:scaffold29374_cov23-Cyclotella_meneghiniana.AAC.1
MEHGVWIVVGIVRFGWIVVWWDWARPGGRVVVWYLDLCARPVVGLKCRTCPRLPVGVCGGRGDGWVLGLVLVWWLGGVWEWAGGVHGNDSLGGNEGDAARRHGRRRSVVVDCMRTL